MPSVIEAHHLIETIYAGYGSFFRFCSDVGAAGYNRNLLISGTTALLPTNADSKTVEMNLD